jgi:hypothetical protein
MRCYLGNLVLRVPGKTPGKEKSTKLNTVWYSGYLEKPLGKKRKDKTKNQINSSIFVPPNADLLIYLAFHLLYKRPAALASVLAANLHSQVFYLLGGSQEKGTRGLAGCMCGVKEGGRGG